MSITIIKDFCKGCGFCIEYCPKKVYELSEEMNRKGYRLPFAVHAEECTECELCDLHPNACGHTITWASTLGEEVGY